MGGRVVEAEIYVRGVWTVSVLRVYNAEAGLRMNMDVQRASFDDEDKAREKNASSEHVAKEGERNRSLLSSDVRVDEPDLVEEA